MTRARRRGRVTVLASYLVAGALLLQLGGCLAVALNFGVTAFDFSQLLDENELFFGIAPCGRPNIQYVDADGNPVGNVLYTEDDLIWDCPVTEVVQGGG
ncbi:MAG: hypothetical protein JXQ75_06770 [Phycisphaerae bacterium]|nr:hypothetical protein [Phycisphaerae bacterium]